MGRKALSKQDHIDLAKKRGYFVQSSAKQQKVKAHQTLYALPEQLQMAGKHNDKIEEVDVLICGSGSAGLCAAAYLARCGISCTVIEARNGPLEMGQADGVQCRTVEVFESFGLAEDLLREAYHVIEDTFWSTDEEAHLVRVRIASDTPKGVSHMPHLILNQARLHDILIEAARKWNGQTIEYGRRVVNIEVDEEVAARDPESHAVTATTMRGGMKQIIRAKYALVRFSYLFYLCDHRANLQRLVMERIVLYGKLLVSR